MAFRFEVELAMCGPCDDTVDTRMAGCAGAQYGNLTRPMCHAALSAVTPTNRPRLATCMTEGCSADYCFWDIQ